MKRILYKRIILIITMLLGVSLFDGCTSVDKEIKKISNNKNQELVLTYDEAKDSIIRFHVIANSDSEEDQNLKLKVKNEVIEYLYDKLDKSESLEESRQIIKDNMEDVKKIASQVINNSNYSYDVKVELGRENFPDKAYGNIVLPQGNYEAFRVIIGQGEGKNWWCVMFPPLCFVDESKAQVQYEETEEKLKHQINDKDISEENNNTKIKFKVVEVIKDLLK